MTEHQKRMATFWISGKRRLRRDSQQRFLTNGDRVRFTKIIYEGYDNIEFEINDCPDWSIWFSQLNLVHVTAEIAGFAVPFIRFKNGDIKYINKMTADQFYKKVKGKTFEVITFTTFAAVNPYSNDVYNLPGQTYPDVLNYIIDCIENNKMDRIGDILKPGSFYTFNEI